MNSSIIKQIIQAKITNVWQAAHTETGHRYLNTKTGKYQQSVTTKLQILGKHHLINWAVKMGAHWILKEDRMLKLASEYHREEMIQGMQLAHTDIRDDAGHVGTRAHDCIERYINEWIASGERPTDMVSFMVPNSDPRSIAAARAAEKWFKEADIIPIASELLVGDDKYSSGTLDFLCILNGRLTLIDHKTSNAIDQDSYSMQIAAYKYFFEKMTGLKILDCKILHLSKDSDKFTIWNVKDLPKAWKAFKAVCAIFDWSNAKKDKIIKDVKRLTI